MNGPDTSGFLTLGQKKLTPVKAVLIPQARALAFRTERYSVPESAPVLGRRRSIDAMAVPLVIEHQTSSPGLPAAPTLVFDFYQSGLLVFTAGIELDTPEPEGVEESPHFFFGGIFQQFQNPIDQVLGQNLEIAFHGYTKQLATAQTQTLNIYLNSEFAVPSVREVNPANGTISYTEMDG